MVAKFLDLNNLSWRRRPFALSNDGIKVWATVLLRVQSCSGKSHMSIFFSFICHICRTTVAEIQRFCCHGNVTWRLLLSIESRKKEKWKRGRGKKRELFSPSTPNPFATFPFSLLFALSPLSEHLEQLGYSGAKDISFEFCLHYSDVLSIHGYKYEHALHQLWSALVMWYKNFTGYNQAINSRFSVSHSVCQARKWKKWASSEIANEWKTMGIRKERTWRHLFRDLFCVKISNFKMFKGEV